MADIVLATLNAKFIHASFGLRCLLANLGELRPRAALLEFDIHQRPTDIAEAILAQEPRIVGLGVYIWNVGPTTELVAILKRVQPRLVVVLGGPEVSHETAGQPIVEAADQVITGEADLAFAAFCRDWLAGRPSPGKILAAPLPDFSQLQLPYDEYTAADIAHRIVYVEASRGCPFSCEFCLSSLEVPVRSVPLEPFLAEMVRLKQRGVRHFKFVDRTFNLNPYTSQRILEFCRDQYEPGMLYHFELIPDRLPEGLKVLIEPFPPGALQFEVGVQTFNAGVAERIQRKQNSILVEDNLRFLRQRTGVHVHADLIAGLPGEDGESFAAGFDRLVAARPQEIQVGILKRLKGTTLARHDAEWGMVYNPQAPYEILKNKLLSFSQVQRIKRFARFWDLVGNSGNFVEATEWLWRRSDGRAESPFAGFLRWSDWAFGQTRRTDAIALPRLLELLYQYLTSECKHSEMEIAEVLWRDYVRTGHTDCPMCLRAHLSPTSMVLQAKGGKRSALKRQERHAGLKGNC
jgi:radical SAM superfamily enzyme YgiQ (UPF0313 family)